MFLTLATMTEVYAARAFALLKDRKGVSALEYAVLAVAIVAVVATGAGLVGKQLGVVFGNIVTQLGG